MQTIIECRFTLQKRHAVKKVQIGLFDMKYDETQSRTLGYLVPRC